MVPAQRTRANNVKRVKGLRKEKQKLQASEGVVEGRKSRETDEPGGMMRQYSTLFSLVDSRVVSKVTKDLQPHDLQ